MTTETYDGVDFVCPLCGMTCGWNQRREIYDGVEIESENKRIKRYAHRSCLERQRENART